VAIQADGKLVVAGISSNGSDSDFAVVRYNSDGTQDTAFGSGGKVTTDINSSADTATAVAIQPDGKIVVAGFVTGGATADFAVVRYNTDGGLDSSFGTGGKVTTDIGSSDNYATALVIQPDGKIVVAGFSPLFFAIVRYGTNGTLDPTFGAGGKVTTDFGSGTDDVRALSIQADGKLVVAGSSVNGTTSDFALARYNTDGSLDTTFGTGGKVTTAIGSKDDNGFALAIQGDGKLVVAGNSNNGSTVVFALARYNSNGSLDPTFGTTGTVITDINSRPAFATALGVQANGKLVVGGTSFNGSNNDFVVVRYNTDGNLDNSFGGAGKVFTDFSSDSDEARALAIQGDGKLIVVGNSTIGNNFDFALAQYLGDDLQPALTISPSSLDFGTVPVGTSKDLTFTVQNTVGEL